MAAKKRASTARGGAVKQSRTKKSAIPKATRLNKIAKSPKKVVMNLPVQATAALSCPTHVYAGTVQLDDANRRAFLATQGGTYLMILDPDCSGVFNPNRVAAAYAAYRYNPGRNGGLNCNGFLHEDGSAQVLHVVS